ncbi:MAG TPA: type I-U CRISPR-associated protein Csx17 [Bryobacteraceae bacterium]|nr:type I-U CRISPR-associated protein Csx17 [Bryobacteraceae bacterium]
MNRVSLLGCAAEPLGSYLKALAVLRLVAEQEDPEARGWWVREGWFCLESKLDEDGLVEFFERRYRPTPILAPWNGGSGFYESGGNDSDVIQTLADSIDPRLELYRKAIELVRAMPEVVAGKEAARKKEKGKRGKKKEVAEPGKAKADWERRTAIQLACRNNMPDEFIDWLDAAIGISAEGERFFPPILGTGGNDGRLDYTNNFMERVAQLLLAPGESTRPLLRNSLFGDATAAFEDGAVGQYDPGRAGGFNQGEEVETKDIPANPWNFVLTLEGAVAWAAGLYRRQGVGYRSFLCSPFTVKTLAVGYGSASAKDSVNARAEIWAPLWERPAGYGELRTLLREGRAAVDGKPARNGLEFAEAACMLGVDRGITGFVRYNLLMRRGKSYIALPAGRFSVRKDERSEADLIRQLGAVLEEANWRLKDAPEWYASLRRQVEEAMYDCLLRGGGDWLKDVAAATGRFLRAILLSGRTDRFASHLGREWIGELQEYPEARIAAALAGMWHPAAGEFRDHLDRKHKRFAWTGSRLEERMARVLERRILSGGGEEDGYSPLASRSRILPEDAILFLERTLDDELIEDLVFAFTLVDWKGPLPEKDRQQQEVEIWPLYALLKHMFLDCAVKGEGAEVKISADLNALSLLRAGNVERAAEIATRKLKNKNLKAPEVVYAGGFDGMRLAAAVLVPAYYTAALNKFVVQEKKND